MNRRDALRSIVALPVVGPTIVDELAAAPAYGWTCAGEIPSADHFYVYLVKSITLEDLKLIYPPRTETA